MKKLIFLSIMVFNISNLQAADKWTGPTSPIDPMWGAKGSSIMAEALRQKPQPNPLSIDREWELKRAYEKGKKDAECDSSRFGIQLFGDR